MAGRNGFRTANLVCVLFIRVILSNGLAQMGFYRVFERAVSVLGNVSLSLFGDGADEPQTVELASLALPMVAIRRYRPCLWRCTPCLLPGA